MWQITGVSRHIYFNTDYAQSWLDNYRDCEKYCELKCLVS